MHSASLEHTGSPVGSRHDAPLAAWTLRMTSCEAARSSIIEDLMAIGRVPRWYAMGTGKHQHAG